MNTKAEKALRRLFREVCKRNNVVPTQAFWKSYRNDLIREGMYGAFVEQALSLHNKPKEKLIK